MLTGSRAPSSTSPVSEAVLRNPGMRRVLGISMEVSSTPSRDHIRHLRAAPFYMSYPRIADLSGVAASTLSQIVAGRRSDYRQYQPVTRVHRDTEAAILGVKPELEPPEGRRGHVLPTATVRRLQALLALGFPMLFLSQQCGMGDEANAVHRTVNGKNGRHYVFRDTHIRVAEAYDRLHAMTPDDFGIKLMSSNRTRKSAAQKGYAPPTCWDDDTIDDPDALPEWTGECGSEHGYQIHYREKIPYCEPCRRAHRAYKDGLSGAGEARAKQNAELEQYLADGWSVEKIADELGVSRRTVERRLKERAA